AVDAAQRISASLFSGSITDLTASDLAQLAQDGMPSVQIERAQAGLIDALVAGGLAKSKSEARTFIQSGAVSINGNKIEALDYQVADSDRLFGQYSLLKRGKKNHTLISWI
nr:tyrosine--tRNA ligase [Vogesella sp.]